ncbi:MAG TPA: cyclic nucleotide-binding domain-containing protein [Terriglobales bacterium]|nr:cyclic nucleotide-binding domain-containing protein [Terriglobales bacterium]
MVVVPSNQQTADIWGRPCGTCEIRSFSVCSCLSPTELEKLRTALTTSHFAAGESLIHEGEPAAALFNIVKGTVKLYKLLSDGRRQITGFLVPGDFLGIALNKTYAYSAEAIEDVQVCRFDRARFSALLGDLPKLEHRLLEAACTELAAAQDQMLLLGRRTALERVASFLLQWHQRFAAHGKGEKIVLPMSRSDIADYLGLTIETVSRSLTALRRSKVIDLVSRSELVIHNPHKLAAMTDHDTAA